jgi:hypothetical protein
MAHPNCDERRQAVERILSAGISIGGREARILSVLFGCLISAIKSDAKVVRAADRRSSAHKGSTSIEMIR